MPLRTRPWLIQPFSMSRVGAIRVLKGKMGGSNFHRTFLLTSKQNNVVWAKITESGSFDQAMVIFHHWNASARNRQIANFFSQRGITVVEIAMPYHFERSRPGSVHADYMLSPNLGRTIQSVRQAVLDGRKLIRWLKSEGYREISVLGMSLGSWVAGLIAAHDLAVSKASLFLTAGSLADMVWTGRATRSIRDSLEPEIELTDLRRAWGPLNLENYAHSLARPDLDLHVVLAKRDKVVLPELSERFMQRLKDAGAQAKYSGIKLWSLFARHAALHFVGRFELEAVSKARPLSGFCRLLTSWPGEHEFGVGRSVHQQILW